MPNRPLAVMMSAGVLVFFVALGGSYLWATLDPPESIPSPDSEPAEQVVDEPDTAPELNVQELGFTDWEEFERYDGEREEMLGIDEGVSVRLRRGPSEQDEAIREVTGRALFERIDHWEDWFLARARNGTIGWIPDQEIRRLNIPRPVARRFVEQLPPLADRYREQLPARFDGRNQVRVTSDYANFRGGPGTQFGRLRRVRQEERLILLAREDDWFRVETTAGETGWIHGNLVEPNWATDPSSWERTELAAGAELRPGPGTEYRGEPVPEDQLDVTVIDTVSDWLQVERENGRIGWVNRNHTAP